MALYGFMELADVAADRINSDQLIDRVNVAIQQSVDEHNRQMNALLGLFVERTTAYKARFVQTSAHRLQPLDDNGRALPVKITGHYDVAWPIQSAGSAWGANYVTRAKMTVADAERITASMLEADMRWLRDHVLAALFADNPWTFGDPEYGNLAIEPLADGGPETYQKVMGADTMTTDTHIRGFANAINDGSDNALISLADDLREHPENRGAVVFVVDSTSAVAIADLDTFYERPDANLRVGSGATELVGSLSVPVPGDVLGYEAASRSWVVEWQALPSNYVIGVTTDGIKPLRMREDPEPELQGFQRVAERNDHPFYESQWLRRAGFGAWNRVGAVVAEIADSTYDVPTGYAVPMP
ncbi:MAG: hypothetical protein KC442_10550 [Thermomicrobiales bacterium]|nr:hypothetical protein [Thermomicrobiales bacterium]MCB0057897.1 hypothetical protein [Caldilineaceae bacterium]